MISSVSPSLKNSVSASALMLTNGSTTTESTFGAVDSAAFQTTALARHYKNQADKGHLQFDKVEPPPRIQVPQPHC
jgi:hypothetical protein